MCPVNVYFSSQDLTFVTQMLFCKGYSFSQENCTEQPEIYKRDVES